MEGSESSSQSEATSSPTTSTSSSPTSSTSASPAQGSPTRGSPTMVSPTTVKMKYKHPGSDQQSNEGGGMMEVIRSDGQQVYHTVNVDADGAVNSSSNATTNTSKSAETIRLQNTAVPVTLSSATMSSNNAIGNTGKTITIGGIAGLNVIKALSTNSAATIGQRKIIIKAPVTSLTGSTTKSTPMIISTNPAVNIQTVQNVQKRVAPVSILPARAPGSVIAPRVPMQYGKQTYVFMPKTQSQTTTLNTAPRIVMPANLGGQMKGTLIPLVGGGFKLSRNAQFNTLQSAGGKQVVTLLPQNQGQTARLPGTTPLIVAPPPNISLSQTLQSAGGKQVVTLLPQNQQTARLRGTTPLVVAPPPNISLLPGYALVPVSSSNALKPSDVLNIPASTSASTTVLDNQALSDLLKSIAQQTVSTQDKKPVSNPPPKPLISAVQPVTPVFSSPLSSAKPVNIAPIVFNSSGTTGNFIPPPLKVQLPVSAPTSLIMPTQQTSLTATPKAVVQLSTANGGSNSGSISVAKQPFGDLKIDSVFSLNYKKMTYKHPDSAKKSNDTENSAKTSEEHAKEPSKDNGINNNDPQDSDNSQETESENNDKSNVDDEDDNQNESNDLKEDFVVLAEWAKESDNEEDFDETDVDSDANEQNDCQNSRTKDDASDKDSDVNDNCVDIETVKGDGGQRRDVKVLDIAPIPDGGADEDDAGSNLTENMDGGDDHDADDGVAAVQNEMRDEPMKVQKEQDNEREKEVQKKPSKEIMSGHGAANGNCRAQEKDPRPDGQVAKAANTAQEREESTAKSETGRKESHIGGKGDASDKVKEPKGTQIVTGNELCPENGPVKMIEEKVDATKPIGPNFVRRFASRGPGSINSDSPRAMRLKPKKRKLKKIMKVRFWKREHQYMFDCAVRLAKLSKEDSVVDVTTFKPPVVPQYVTSRLRYTGDPNWSDVLVGRVPDRLQWRIRAKEGNQDEEGMTAKEKLRKKKKSAKPSKDDVFIVKTINGESKLVKVSMPEKKDYTQSLITSKEARATTTSSTGTNSLAKITSSTATVASTVTTFACPHPSAFSTTTSSPSATTQKYASNTSTASGAAPMKIIVANSNVKKDMTRIAKATNVKGNISYSSYMNNKIAKATGRTIFTIPNSGGQVAIPPKSGQTPGTSAAVAINSSTKKVSLIPIAPAKSCPEVIPVSVGGTSVNVPISMLFHAQALGCKLAFKVPTSTNKTPIPLLISQTSSTATRKPTYTPATTTARPAVVLATATTPAVSAATTSVSSPTEVSPLVITPISSEQDSQDAPNVSSSAASTSAPVPTSAAPIVIRPMAPVASTAPTLTASIISLAKAAASSGLSKSTASGISTTSTLPAASYTISKSAAGTTLRTTSSVPTTLATTTPASAALKLSTFPRGGNQKYLVLNTSSGKMIMPMPAALSGATAVPGKSILNLHSIVPKPATGSLPTSTSASPVFIMAGNSANALNSVRQQLRFQTTGSTRMPMLQVRRGVPNIMRYNPPQTQKAIFTVRPPGTSQVNPVRVQLASQVGARLPGPRITSATTPMTIFPRPVVPLNSQTTTATSTPRQRSPAARQNRMIQRLSEFMSPAAAAALQASVPAEPIEIAPMAEPIKIEPTDSADFDFPVTIKDEPITIGYGDEDGPTGPSLENIQIKDEPPSSDSDSDSDENNGESPAKQRRLDNSAVAARNTNVQTETNCVEASPVPKNIDPPPTHDARSRIDELREKLRKAMADVDEIRHQRQKTADSMDES